MGRSLDSTRSNQRESTPSPASTRRVFLSSLKNYYKLFFRHLRRERRIFQRLMGEKNFFKTDNLAQLTRNIVLFYVMTILKVRPIHNRLMLKAAHMQRAAIHMY
jgi:hypothetical protein